MKELVSKKGYLKRFLTPLNILPFVVVSCSSMQSAKPDRVIDPNYSTCIGDKARGPLEFMISAPLRVEKGTRIRDIERLSNETSIHYESLVNHFIYFLLSEGLKKSPDGKNLSWDSPSRSPLIQYFPYTVLQEHREALLRTGPFRFVLCKNNMCAGLTDPVTGKKVVDIESMSPFQSANKCHWYHVEGIEDPNEESCARYGNVFSIRELARDTGFRSGTIFNFFYFTLPETDKDDLCIHAGLKAGCYNSENLDAYTDSKEPGDPGHPLAKFPFNDAFIDSECKNGDARPVCVIHIKKRLKSEASLRKEWESDFTKDLLLLSSAKISKSLNSDWVSYRIAWDPTLFCKYAKPLSDLYTH